MTQLTTPFGYESTAAEVIAGVDLTGQRAIVTGGAAGIGVETARALASAGAHVTLAVRNPAAGEAVATELRATTGNPHIDVQVLDLADRASIARFVQRWQEPLHILVNNAGVMGLPESHTADGWEMQFATNHLGHMALTLGLHRALGDGAAQGGGARVVVVSSSAHLYSPVIFDDVDFVFRPYDPILSYGQSKTANVLFAVAANARWAGAGITVNALMPGAIATGLQKHLGGMRTPVELRKTPEQGAATSVLLATSPLLGGIGGRYFEDCNEAAIAVTRGDGRRGVAAYALDATNADRLWTESLRRLGMDA